ncbi:DUF1801 domain-containing protein [Rhizobacter sp. AJA081-3]|uniref:DUF1801 domain-containing protein n=1 Tax=Rhizobacter sp. AJA081-3 TaxID=2753607 RepID=UPI001ADFB100|nr:DUF1801 domain-containing protein [Rhizobacter sp. AJA081-3]QTN21449.1 DUF1801 domain-containing protein [Rhizobacter sp. AJA081-3]
MAEAKTKPTQASVERYIDAIADPERRGDAESLLKLMRRATASPSDVGSSIVGFGKYPYSYATGRSGESCATGFAARKGDISVYLVASGPSQQELLSRLGRHKMGKSCLSIKRLADVDLKVLEQLVAESYAEVHRLHPSSDA